MNSFRLTCLITALLALLIADQGLGQSSAESSPQVAVEEQPLAANLQRVVTTMQSLGTPLPDAILKSLSNAFLRHKSIDMQDAIDSQVLFVVQINPEERVKVARGPATAILQQHGFTPVLVKILNSSSSSKRLRIVSPQSGAVYAGVARNSMQRQQSLDLIENQNEKGQTGRFLSVDLFDQPPMSARLSGLEVEYAVALILSTESGRREATIGFDLGQGEQDLGSRGELPVLFTVRPAVPVRLSILDENGAATTASLIIRDLQGHVYPLQAKRLAPDFFFQPQIYRADGETVLLPNGEFTVQAGRGPEYWVREQKLTVDVPTTNVVNAKQVPELAVRLERWVNPRDYGFFSGDHHIHAAGCAHYTHPTEGVTPEDMFRQVKGEGLNVGCVLTWGPCFRHQRQFFSEKPHDLSEQLTLLKYDLEISGFGSQALGHVCLLNLRDQTYPGSDGIETKGWPTWTTPVMRWAKQQGGITGYAHSASGLAIDPVAATKRMLTRSDSDQDGRLSIVEAKTTLLPESFDRIDRNADHYLDEVELTTSHDKVSDQLPNLAIPEMNGVGAMEICVTAVEGVCDFISAMDTRRIQEWNTWYHLMNSGFPLKVSGETDFPCMSSRRVGQGRVYVQLSNHTPSKPPTSPSADSAQLDFGRWCEGIVKGRSYVSDGFAHALDFRVNGIAPGGDDIQLSRPEQVSISATVCFAPETPSTVAQGTSDPVAQRRLVGDTVELHGPRRETVERGGERLIEIVCNGRPVASQKILADGKRHDLKFEVSVDSSSWIALRQFPQLHTNPVQVIIAGKPIRASRASAQWCEQTIELLWKNRQSKIAVAERDDAHKAFERAKARYREIAEQCDRP